MKGFHELVVWQEAASLAANVLAVAPHVTGFSAIRFADQMVRAADSIPANIAEGYGRGVSRDGLRFLTIARASRTELESHLRAAIRSGRLPAERAEPLIDQTRRVGFLLFRLMESVKRRAGL